jgi:hypothetical protein
MRVTPHWGPKKIHVGLFKLEHAHEIWDCDLTVFHSIFFKPIYAFVIMEHGARKIHILL